MRTENMTSPSSGRPVANQFIITTDKGTLFQSYHSAIAFQEQNGTVHLSPDWDASVTTGKYRNQFLGENIADTRKKIASGEYKMDLNASTGELEQPSPPPLLITLW